MYENMNELNSELPDDMYEVEKILKKRIIVKGGRNEIFYLVKWKGYQHPEDQTWEPLENLQQCSDIVKNFQDKLQEKKERKRKQNEEKGIIEDKRENTRSRSIGNQKIKGTQIEPIEILDKPSKLHKKDSEFSRQAKNKPETRKPDLTKKNSDPRKGKPNPPTENDRNEKRSYEILNSYIETEQTKKQESKYGKVVNYLYKNGKLSYQVERLSNKKKTEKMEYISSETVQKHCLKNAFTFLQSFIINMEKQADKQRQYDY